MSENLKKIYSKNLYIYVTLILTLLVCFYLFDILKFFIISFIVAYLTNPVTTFFNKYFNRTFSSFISILFFVLAFLLLLILILPIIIEQAQNLILILPTYISDFENFIRNLNIKNLFSDTSKIIDISMFIKPISNNFLDTGNKLINNSIQFFNSFFNIILVLVISFYMSLEFSKIKLFFYEIADKSNFKDFKKLVIEIDHVLSDFLRGQGLVCLILSTFYAITLFFIGIKFGILLGIFSGIISFIPYIGAFLGGGLTLLLGFFQFGISIELIFLLIIFITGQFLESYYLTPKFVGNAINLHPIWIIFALLTGAYLSGIVGVLISLPIAAIFGVLVRHYFKQLFK